MQLEKNDSSQKGWNWGKTNFVGMLVAYRFQSNTETELKKLKVRNFKVTP
jgi:hypothetical protein